MIEHSSEGISLLDRNFNVIYRSHSASKITGWPNEERLQQVQWQDIHPEDVHVLKKVLSDIME